MQQTEETILRHAAQLPQQKAVEYLSSAILQTPFLSYSKVLKLSVISSLPKDGRIIQLIKIYTDHTYASYAQIKAQGKLKLSQKELRKLRELSVLDAFQGLMSVDLTELCQEVQLDRLDCLKMLLEMNIAKVIDVKIDEQQNQIQIRGARLRETELSPENSKKNGLILGAKLNKLYFSQSMRRIQTNQKTLRQIQETLQKKEKEQSNSSYGWF